MNPRARVGVKLVSEVGVGTVAAGVAKAYADYVLIAGHNGGTGASPLSSIKHAGSPWELGLAEAQATLLRNGLRHRIEVRTDGGFKTGRDVVIAALLGAESYGFGTAPLVAMGCAMARQCHINTCPTGIATQREDLRAKFKGTPEQVIGYFTMVAEEVRRILAGMGFRTHGRDHRPAGPARAGGAARRAAGADARPLGAAGADRRGRAPSGARRVRCGAPWSGTTGRGWSRSTRRSSRSCEPYLESGLPFSGNYPIYNHHLAVGARVAGAIVERTGDAGLAPGSVRLRFTGSAGQSFGAFTCRGMHLELEGEANDYVGKGLSGGEITIRPFRRAAYADVSHQHLIIGNTVLYGATGGKLFAAGQAGDRFAVRNSGAIAVIEGAGNHCCEYMTSGIVVVLGRAGRNFGAGMSNGVAYVLDETGTFDSRRQPRHGRAGRPGRARRRSCCTRLVREHEERTASPRARTILVQWESFLPLFRKVAPKGAEAYIAATREAYLASERTEVEPALARRTRSAARGSDPRRACLLTASLPVP